MVNENEDSKGLAEFNLYADSMRLSMMLLTFCATVFLIVRIRFGEDQITTLTLQPYIITLLYCSAQILLTLLTEVNDTYKRDGKTLQYTFPILN